MRSGFSLSGYFALRRATPGVPEAVAESDVLLRTLARLMAEVRGDRRAKKEEPVWVSMAAA